MKTACALVRIRLHMSKLPQSSTMVGSMHLGYPCLFLRVEYLQGIRRGKSCGDQLLMHFCGVFGWSLESFYLCKHRDGVTHVVRN